VNIMATRRRRFQVPNRLRQHQARCAGPCAAQIQDILQQSPPSRFSNVNHPSNLTFVNDTDPFLPGLNPQGNSDVPRALLGPDLHSLSIPEPDSPLRKYSATEHYQSHTPSSGGSANQYNRGVAPPELPSPTRSRVLESPKRDITSPESPSLHQGPTYAPYLSSPSSNSSSLPVSTLSSQSPSPLEPIRTSRVSATEPPNPTVTFAEPELQGESTNGIFGRCYNGWCCHQ